MTIYKSYLYLSIFILLSICTHSKAQFSIRGYVLNENKIAIPNAIIKLKDSATGLTRYFGITNTSGLYQIKLPEISKNYWLECSLLGFKSVAIPLNITKPTSLNDIILISDTATLSEINVYSSPPITISGDTTTFKVDAFKKGIESNLGELLNNIPGFSVNNGTITYNGKQVNTVLIEEDDLFGSDYNILTQNLSPKGIEKIQLIQNYNDKTYLSNRLQKGQELAVNLKFNNKYLYKVIGSIESGASILPLTNFYKLRQNIVSLIPRLKSVTTTNFNNTGMLASEILGNAFNLSEYIKTKKDAVVFDLMPRSLLGTGAILPDINSPIIPKNKMVTNNTTVITNNSLYKPSRNFLAKAVLQYYLDNYQQQQQQTIDYTLLGGNIVIENKQFLQKRLPAFSSSSEIIYSPSKYSQILYKAGFTNIHESDSLYDQRQSFPLYTKYTDNSKRFQHQVGYSWALDTGRIVDIKAMQLINNTDIKPNLYPADLYNTITNKSGFEQLQSIINQSNHEFLFQVKMMAKRSKSNWTGELNYSTSNTTFSSQSNLIKIDSIERLNSDSLRNNSKVTTSIVNGILGYEKELSNKILLRTTHRFEAGNIIYKEISGIKNRNYLHYLPSVSFVFTFNQNRRLNISADMKNALPSASNLSEGYLFANGNTILKGNSAINIGISKNLTATYSFSDMTKKRIFGNASFFFSQSPILYLSNVTPLPFFSINNNILFERDARVTGLILFSSKYFSKLKSQLDVAFNMTRVNSYFSTNNNLGAINFTNSKFSSKLKTLVTSNLTISIASNLTFITQRTKNSNIAKGQNKNTISSITTEVIYRFLNKWVINSKLQYIQQHRALATNDIYFGELLLKYTAIKDKLSFMISGNNLFNDGQFTNINFTQNSINTQNIQLLRPFWMAHVTIDF